MPLTLSWLKWSCMPAHSPPSNVQTAVIPLRNLYKSSDSKNIHFFFNHLLRTSLSFGIKIDLNSSDGCMHCFNLPFILCKAEIFACPCICLLLTCWAGQGHVMTCYRYYMQLTTLLFWCLYLLQLLEPNCGYWNWYREGLWVGSWVQWNDKSVTMVDLQKKHIC